MQKYVTPYLTTIDTLSEIGTLSEIHYKCYTCSIIIGIQCGALDKPKNGFISLSGTAFGDSATYSCKAGFTLEPEGEEMRVCDYSGNWTGSVPKCTSE